MIAPNIGLLIRGLRTELKNTVMPEVKSGAALRQLKAGIHLLGRLERTWDLTSGYLLKDNLDIESCLDQLYERVPELKSALNDSSKKYQSEVSTEGINDPGLQLLVTKNRYLHGCLEAVQQHFLREDLVNKNAAESNKILNALYRRMALRDSLFVGDSVSEKT